MKIETGARQYWEASLAWRGRAEGQDGLTVQHLFDALNPLETHPSWRLQQQASELSAMIVKWKKSRCPKPRRKLTNLVQLPVRTQQKTIAA
jgi:hypothetical protein